MQLDGGHWRNAALIMPTRDPIFTEEFGATEYELESIASYREAIHKLKGRQNSKWYDQSEWQAPNNNKKPWWKKKDEDKG